ncbi:Histidine kinase-, DNA gyrase B-, and HSP90-like ATPase [compost metagenome]
MELRAKLAEGRLLIIEAEDNGRGIPPEELQNIRQRMERESRTEAGGDDRGAGCGTRNVHGRIRALCGEGYGLEIESDYGRGTVSRITIPALRKDDWHGIARPVG